MNEWMTVLLVGMSANIERGEKRQMGMDGRMEGNTVAGVQKMMSLCDHIFVCYSQHACYWSCSVDYRLTVHLCHRDFQQVIRCHQSRVVV